VRAARRVRDTPLKEVAEVEHTACMVNMLFCTKKVRELRSASGPVLTRQQQIVPRRRLAHPKAPGPLPPPPI
jgi:hypothetical protein